MLALSLLASTLALAACTAGGGTSASSSHGDPSTDPSPTPLPTPGSSTPFAYMLGHAMVEARSAALTASLPDGKVLVAGGNSGTLTESYDPASQRFLPNIARLQFARLQGATATPLVGGQVLIAGGYDGSTILSAAEIYDPSTGTLHRTPGDMRTPRQYHTATLLTDGRVLIVGGESLGGSFHGGGAPVLASAELFDPSTGTFTTLAASMSVARANQTATLLKDGKVLLAGGFGSNFAPLNSAEIFDPVTESFTLVGAMSAQRQGHGAAVLPDGRVLVIGGCCTAAGNSLNSTDIFDPDTGRFEVGPTLNAPRAYFALATLSDGNLVVAGGCCDSNKKPLSSAEMFDTAAARFVGLPSMTSLRSLGSAVTLADGRALIVGGCCDEAQNALATAELFDPADNSFKELMALAIGRSQLSATPLSGSPAGAGNVLIAGGSTSAPGASLYNPTAQNFTVLSGTDSVARSSQSATTLRDGRVLIVGGYGCSPPGSSSCAILDDAIIYDPASQTFSSAGRLASGPRMGHSATLLPDGRVLIAGGCCTSGGAPLATAEVYSPSGGTFSSVGSMTQPRQGHTATVLSAPGASFDGKVLITGGSGGAGYLALSSCEIFDPATNAFTALSASLKTARSYHSATALDSGDILIAGGQGPAAQPLSSAELFNPSRGEFVSTASMEQARDRQVAVRLDDGRVLVVGGIGLNAGVPGPLASAEIYDPSTQTFSVAGTMVSARAQAAAALLSDGSVLIVGGLDGSGYPLASAELLHVP